MRGPGAPIPGWGEEEESSGDEVESRGDEVES